MLRWQPAVSYGESLRTPSPPGLVPNERTSTGKPEHTLTIAIEGNYAFHTVQKTWRSDPVEPEIAAWTREFFPAVSVCDAAGHPCATSGAP